MDKTIVDTTKVKKEEKKSNAYEGVKLCITVIDGCERSFGKTFNFFKNMITIGRGEENDITLPDKKISKDHCMITAFNQKKSVRIELVDLDSTNGTYVNGELIKQDFIHSGDKIELGDVTLRLTINDEIEEKYHSKLFNFATIDELTGLYNKRYIQTELDSNMRIAKRNKRELSILMIDIDNFKQLNDSYGHLAGDEFLKKLAFILNNTLREQDIAGRFGGEEFIILLPETGLSGSITIAERIRKNVEEAVIHFDNQDISTTVSVGIAEFKSSNAKEFINAADKALYQAKKAGKNKVSF